MAETKTKPTKVSVTAYINAIEDPERRKDCRTLVAMMTKLTKAKATMWGPSIVGFGSYHYKYESGHEGDSCVAAFASRTPALSVYIMGDFPDRTALLGKLGKHKMAKACLYISRLADVDLAVLEKLIGNSVKAVTARYPHTLK
jgi:hypothetical protein